MSLRSTFDEEEVTSRVTAVTAIGARVEEYCETIFELSDVPAARSRLSRSLRSTGMPRSSRNSTDLAAAFWNDCAIVVG